MPDHDTDAVLAHHVGRLDAEACAALVADLWAVRGLETSREGRDVVATGRGGTRRIRVGPTGASPDPPDVLVRLRGGRNARGATAAGVRVIDAEDLAGMLRYAVDRSTADALCERHLGAPPDGLRPPAGERLRTRVRGLRAAAAGRFGTTESPVAPASFLAAVLLLLAAGAVAGVALTGSPEGPSASVDADLDPASVPASTPVGDAAVVTPTGAPGTTGDSTPGNASVIPGVTEAGVVDLSALAAAHARGLLGRSYTLWMDTYRPPPGDPDAPRTQFDTDVAVAGDRFLIEENVGDDGDRRRLRTVYHDGEDWYIANETADGTVYERITLREPTPPPSPNPDDIALGLVADYLSTPETDVEGRAEDGARAGGPALYRLVGRGTPTTMDQGTVRNYTAVALVDRDGLVRDLTVTYTRVTGDGSYRVRKEWTYGHFGETTVEPPGWYVDRFATNGTAPSGMPDG